MIDDRQADRLDEVREVAEQFASTPLHPKEDPREAYAAAQKGIMRALIRYYRAGGGDALRDERTKTGHGY